MGRKRYFVRGALQGRFIAAFVALAVLGAVGAAVATALAAEWALDEARFRAHFTERSTRELLLPVLLKVNGAAALAMIVGGLIVARVLFARQARALDALCARLGSWERELGLTGGGPPAASDSKAISAGLARGWAADLDEALRVAETALRAAYRAAHQEASTLAADATKLEGALAENGPKRDLARDVEAVGECLGRIEAVLARSRPANRS